MFVWFARTTHFASFPDHLVIQIKKFTFGLDWVPKKLGKNILWLSWNPAWEPAVATGLNAVSAQTLASMFPTLWTSARCAQLGSNQGRSFYQRWPHPHSWPLMWRLKVSWVPMATRRTTHSTPHCCVSLSCHFSSFPSPSQPRFPPFLSSSLFCFLVSFRCRIIYLLYKIIFDESLDFFKFIFAFLHTFNTKQLFKRTK